jgi:hypothetical protein
MVSIRPLSPLGFADTNWKDIGYTSEEFIAFYKETFEYILSLAREEVDIKEGQVFPPTKSSFRCRINKGILDILFGLIKKNDDSIIEIFKRWI